MLPIIPFHRRRRSNGGFSLVEVALSLGVVGFVLAGLIGAIPLASNVGRQSIEQSRAASIAGTIFATFRAQKFSAVSLLDENPTPLDLNTLTTTSNAQTYYAYFDEMTTNTATDGRRLHFVSAAPGGTLTYQVTLRFNNTPPGTLAPYTTSASATHAQANAVEVSVNSVARPKDVYRFSSVVANRSE